MSADRIAGLVEAVGAAAKDFGRADLAARLAGVATRVRMPHRQVLVMGDYKQGKSSLVNALLAADVCPVDDDLATSVPTVVEFAEKVNAAVAVGDADDRGHAQVTPVTLSEARRAASDQSSTGVRWVRIGIPRSFLKQGVTVVDTPGTGGIASPAAALALSVADRSSIVVAVSDATQELTASELEFLRLAAARCPNVVLALTKTDLSQHWRRIAELNRAHLDKDHLREVRVVPTSSALRMVALRREDRDLNQHSGYPALIRELHQTLGRPGHAEHALDQADDALEQLMEACQAARAVLRAPREADRVAAELAEARHRADRLRRGAVRWQQVLSDGVASLTSDADYDLRARLRALRQEVEAAIDQSDPLDSWEEIRDQLGKRVVEELIEHHHLLQERSALVAHSVAEQFVELGSPAAVPVEGLAGLRPQIRINTPDLELARSGVGARMLSTLRAGASTVSMFGLLTTMVGFAVVNPISLAAGIALGAKALRDESARELSARRTAAKSASRQAIEEITMAEAKLSRDVVRAVHRELREGFAARAEELQAALDAAVQAAQEAGRTERSNREAEAKRLETRWHTLTRLRADVRDAIGSADRPRPPDTEPRSGATPNSRHPSAAEPVQVNR